MIKKIYKTALLAGTCLGLGATGALAQSGEVAPDEGIENIVITSVGRTYSSNATTQSMAAQQAPLTSVLSQIDNLPGVNVTEGDTFGFDDWSTQFTVRGFQVSLSEQQLGLTIDGLPNGGSNYGGGSKANRFIDTQNLAGIEVFQGTADIGSRSNDALGGTLNFRTSDPLNEERTRVSASLGDFEARRLYGRYDTGRILGDTTKAWVSLSSQTATDWMEGSSENRRDHIAAKVIANVYDWQVTAYASYDDTEEDNYQRLYSPVDFQNNSRWDQLTGEWTGIPYVDQSFRQGWSTLRENFFAYVKAESDLTDELHVKFSGYRHDNDGRGDWVPPYLVDVEDNLGGPESEFLGASTIHGDPILGRIFFVDPTGVSLTPAPGCVSSITFPYGGAGAEYDPACYPANAIAVQSFRHTHYQKERSGLTADLDWQTSYGDLDSELRGGIWFEDATRYEYRDWHKITDTTIGANFDNSAYYVQYDREYPQTTFKWYIEETATFGPLTAKVGIKQFSNEVERLDNFALTPNVSLNNDSDVLLSGGFVWNTYIEGLELFGGYAENYKALNDLILERPASALDGLEPETSEVVEFGFRYVDGPFTAALTLYDVEFANRLLFLDSSTVAGPDYTIGTDGSFFNAGGIESQGLEFIGTWQVNDGLSLYGSYTYNDSAYIGPKDAVVDAAVGIVPGAQAGGIPETMYVISADYRRNNFYTGVSSKYVDDRSVYANGTFVADSYTLTDLYAGVSGEMISDELSGVDFRLTANNVFDVDYLGTIAVNSGAWIGSPRTVVLSVTLDF